MERIDKAIERLTKCKSKSSQNRLETFFGPSVIIPGKKKVEPEKKGKGKGKLSGIAKKKK